MAIGRRAGSAGARTKQLSDCLFATRHVDRSRSRQHQLSSSFTPAPSSRRPHQSVCFSSPMTQSEDCLLTGSSCDPSRGWRHEAEAVIADICDYVNHVSVSDRLPCDQWGAYLNIETKESLKVTVEMSNAGFRVCGHTYDTNDCLSESAGKRFETIYALLQDCSPGYRTSFSSALSQKLIQLSHQPNHRPDET